MSDRKMTMVFSMKHESSFMAFVSGTLTLHREPHRIVIFGFVVTIFYVRPKDGGGFVHKSAPIEKSNQILQDYIFPDRSRRAEHFLSQNLVSKTLPSGVLLTSICEIIVHAATVLHRLDLNA